MSTIRIVAASFIIGSAVSVLGISLLAHANQAPNEVVRVKMPLDLPGIGNINAAKHWRFGRIESVVQVGAADDVKINIRIADGTVLEVIGPRVLSDLARASNWVSAEPSKEQLTRSDYVERMVAFDVDDANRIIAMISMEPIERDRRRLLRGLQ